MEEASKVNAIGYKNLDFLVIASLAVVFTIALTFATLEALRLVNSLLSAHFLDFGFEFKLDRYLACSNNLGGRIILNFYR
ncbi:hypothetical protein DRN86_04680 [Candidatus Geothermarchaeota archaeon]|nr:MAG: hypothetical protein DRN86_04680 [Candidatus Geothermarchaeota archaeon]